MRKDQGRQWNIYDWKGELSRTLEGEEESWLSLSGSPAGAALPELYGLL